MRLAGCWMTGVVLILGGCGKGQPSPPPYAVASRTWLNTVPDYSFENGAEAMSLAKGLAWLAVFGVEDEQREASDRFVQLYTELGPKGQASYSMLATGDDAYHNSTRRLILWDLIETSERADSPSQYRSVFMSLRPSSRADSPDDPWWMLASYKRYITPEHLQWSSASKTGMISDVSWIAPDTILSTLYPGGLGTWRASDGSLAVTLAAGTTRATALFPATSGQVLFGDASGAVWSLPSTNEGASPVLRYRGSGSISSVASNPDDPDGTIWVSTAKGSVVAIDAGQNPQRTIRFGDEPVHLVADAANGRVYFASQGSSPVGVRAISSATGEELWDNGESFDYVSAIDASRSGARVAVGYSTGRLAMINSDSGETLWDKGTLLSSVLAVAFSPDGRLLLAGGDSTTSVYLFDVATGNVAWVFHDLGESVLSLSWAPDGSRFCSGGADGCIKVWSIP